MQIIGITGGIGSGKSTIARELAKRGFAVYDCDREAKRIIVENEHVRKAIIDLLGEESFVNVQSDDVQCTKYNTAYVAQRVFAEPELLERLNAIVHPAVANDILSLTPSLQDSCTPLFIESAILYESGFNALCEKIIVVDAPEDIRIARTIARDYKGETTEENINKVRARIKAQGIYTPLTLLDVLHLNNDGNTPLPELVDEIVKFTEK